MSTSENNHDSNANPEIPAVEANPTSPHRGKHPIVSDDLTPRFSPSGEELSLSKDKNKDEGESSKYAPSGPSSSRGRKRKGPDDSFDTSIAQGACTHGDRWPN